MVNAVNGNKSLAFNTNDAGFPSHEEQEKIAAGFRLKSGADFDKIMLAVDGMLIWTIEPSKDDCTSLNIRQRLFHCYGKDTYGWLLMAGCDDDTQFRWADIKNPFSTSDYLTWTSSDVGIELSNDDSDLILQDYIIVGDNAFVENMIMATPVPGMHVSEVEDAYNFYLSQIGITIEQAFSILVHRWGLLRKPLADSCRTPSPVQEDSVFIDQIARQKRKGQGKSIPAAAVALDGTGRPTELLGSGHHFRDEPGGRGRRPEGIGGCSTPMRQMMQEVADLDLRRPPMN